MCRASQLAVAGNVSSAPIQTQAKRTKASSPTSALRIPIALPTLAHVCRKKSSSLAAPIALEGFAATFLGPRAARSAIRARIDVDGGVSSTTDGRIEEFINGADYLW